MVDVSLPAVNLQRSLEDGQLGIFARFEMCLFDRNSAVEVGGAFGAAFSVLAQALNSFVPLEIRDWLGEVCLFRQFFNTFLSAVHSLGTPLLEGVWSAQPIIL